MNYIKYDTKILLKQKVSNCETNEVSKKPHIYPTSRIDRRTGRVLTYLLSFKTK